MDLTALQQNAAAVLTGHAYFANGGVKAIPVLTEDLGDLLFQINLATKKTGLFVLVQTPFGLCDKPNLPQPLITARLVCSVVENVTLNRAASGTGETVGRVANAIACLLHQRADLSLPIFKAIQSSANYLPLIARDVVFELPYTEIAMPARPA
jgi:hypothetical protein